MSLKLPEGISVEHLAPILIECPCEAIERPIKIRVIFHNHCYTESFVEGAHSRDDIITYDAPDRPRVFCPIRHKLSKHLPTIIGELPTKRVHQTTQVRNYVYVVQLSVSNEVYEIYFMLQRAQPEDEADLRLTVESAYPDESPPALPKRPREIRFKVLAQKVLMKQPVRFAAR